MFFGFVKNQALKRKKALLQASQTAQGLRYKSTYLEVLILLKIKKPHHQRHGVPLINVV